MSKLWAVALLACALGTNARAANVAVDEAQVREAVHTCWTGGYGSLDFPKGYGAKQALFPSCLQTKGLLLGVRRSDRLALDHSDWVPLERSVLISAIETCAEKDEPYCVEMLAYIRQHWGVR